VHCAIDSRLEVVEGNSNGVNPILYSLTCVEELVNSEDRFTEVKAALKGLAKLDLDKLIVSVRRCIPTLTFRTMTIWW
jgi:hypothetical protein